MIRRPPRSTQSRSSAASDVYKRQPFGRARVGADGVVALDAVVPVHRTFYVDREVRAHTNARVLLPYVRVGADGQAGIGRDHYWLTIPGAVGGKIGNLDGRGPAVGVRHQDPGLEPVPGAALGEEILLSLIHISEPTRLGMISYAVFCL